MQDTYAFVRNSGDDTSHIALGAGYWTAEALCGARPRLRDIGWFSAAGSAYLAGLTVCEECKDANRARLGIPEKTS